MMNLLLIFYVAVVFLLPGYVLLKKFAKLKELETISLAPAVSLVLYGAVFYALHILFGINVNIGTIAVILAVSAVCWVGWGLKPDKKSVPHGLRTILILALVVRLVMVQFEPMPRVGDNIIQFIDSKSFLGDDWYSSGALESFWDPIRFPYVASHRPPLNAFALSLLAVFSGSYEVAQIFGIIMGVGSILPAYLIAKRFMTEKNSLTTALLIGVNPFLVDFSLQVSPKVLMSYAALLVVYFQFRNASFSNWFWMGIAAGVGLLSHYAFLILIAAMLAYQIYNGLTKESAQNIIKMLTLLLVLMSPWLIRNYVVFGNPVYSNSKYFFMKDQAEYNRLEPPSAKGYFTQPFSKIFFDKMGSILNTFVPVAGTINDLVFYSSFNLENFKHRFLGDPCVNSSLLCILTPPLFVLLFASFVYITNFSRFVLYYLLTGIIFGSVVIGFNAPAGHVNEFLLPVIPLAIVSSLHWASKKTEKSTFKWIVRLSLFFTVLLLAHIFYINHFSEKYGVRYPLLRESYNDEVYPWIVANTDSKDVIMVDSPLVLNLLTGRPSVAVPFENTDRIEQTISRYNVSYLMLPKGKEVGAIDTNHFFDKYPLVFGSERFLILRVKN